MNLMLRRIVIAVILFKMMPPLLAQEVRVVSGLEEVLTILEQDGWWTERKQGEQLKVPYQMIVAISDRWQKNSPKLPVPTKKDIFFTSLLPLVVHANNMVLDRRDQLKQADGILAKGNSLTPEDIEDLKEAAVLLRIKNREESSNLTDPKDFREVIKEALYKLDIIPAGLVLGQAAYESGWGTSRFAVEGNALFGQWTFGGKGLIPEQQREHLGDHRIASFEWPFDSVRGYFLNLSSHPAYEDFRRIRAELKAAGKPLSSLSLADGLLRYSERGQVYVDTLKGMIRANRLDIADDAVFKEEPMSFLLGAEDQTAAAKLRKDIEAMRKSGELSMIIERMRLD